ncbi:GbsR/MarR family transcriptional regulator [Sediminibacterium ginsengisoli]|uniref:HTH-type transcriptional regulator n=1 Tax=Sediminibacterium ginsengisoli TaxID=413434 RepID=A0A1T4NHC0_9BACT|nr:MarR family transcriptional regulator [Sediminibacterium ginsengisoli]SJZ78660.1 DNA-binding transcriptional regulator GbsR, MarR family [Sediminibacterium ginsengisoli]
MKLTEAKSEFIQSWGVLGSQWGINRTMAQLHAVLLVANEAMSTDELMEELQVSRGNVNMNIRELMDWGLVTKHIVPGERKEFFSADKDIWRVATKIMYQRKKRELDPMVEVLNRLSEVEGDKRDKDVKAFTDTVNDIRKFAGHAEKTLTVVIKAEENWFWGSFMKMFK